MGVYQRTRKIGYTHHNLVPIADGFAFSEESLLRLKVMNVPRTVRTRMQGRLRRDFTLREVEFELTSGVGSLHVTAALNDAKLTLTLRTGKATSQQVLDVTEPVYLPWTLRASVRARTLQAGQQRDAVVFDPATLGKQHIRLTVGSWEAVPGENPEVHGWRVREELRGGLSTTAWVGTTGRVFREEGPMGLVLVRQTAEQATSQDWPTQTALDLVASAAVPVARPILEPRRRTSLQVRLSGIALDRVPTDDEQVRRGSLLTVTRSDLSRLRSYALPYEEVAHAGDLAATPFLQVRHPRIQALVREVMGGSRDALQVAMRLDDWVYGHLRKVPTISIPNALQVLDMGEGDCNEHAVLYATLARAAGIPTRIVAGTVYVDGSFSYHAWCKVWLGRWVSVDPALHQFPADATHITFVIGGPEQHVAMLGIIGRLGVEVVGAFGGGDRPS
ncbi:MAG: transglutaminase family protein [Candidatus Binatia bacterium]